jgi:GTP-binding protein HflX
MGSGKVEEIAAYVKEHHVDIVILDDPISPHQQRNLEAVIKVPVIDRTELILEVFAKHAQTKEARLQVELAKVRYQLPRLRRLWTHLSRQSARGGAHLKGEGEKQIELDKRLLRRRIDQLKEDIEALENTRKTQRQARLRAKIPTFAIVGYTNAGKSTLLNALTQAGVLAEDKLFATLDTTTKSFELPNHQKILLIDTVGFIKKIPHGLIAAFKSTLEEISYTDILLHVVDVSNPEAYSQLEATLAILKELGCENIPTLTLLNKADALVDKSQIMKFKLKIPKVIPISAKTHEGFDRLLECMSEEISNLRKTVKVKIPQSRYDLVSRLIKEAFVLEQEYVDNDVLMEVEIPKLLEHEIKPFIIKN